jgi:hypothetical protein
MGNYFSKTPASRVIANQTLNSTGGSTASISNGVGTETFQVRIAHNVPGGIWCKIDSGATATAGSDTWIAPNVVGEYFSAIPGMTVSIVSTSTSTGSVSIAEMA